MYGVGLEDGRWSRVESTRGGGVEVEWKRLAASVLGINRYSSRTCLPVDMQLLMHSMMDMV